MLLEQRRGGGGTVERPLQRRADFPFVHLRPVYGRERAQQRLQFWQRLLEPLLLEPLLLEPLLVLAAALGAVTVLAAALGAVTGLARQMCWCPWQRDGGRGGGRAGRAPS